MKIESRVVTIPTNQTNSQLETLLNTMLNNGWSLILITTYGTRQVAIFTRLIAK